MEQENLNLQFNQRKVTGRFMYKFPGEEPVEICKVLDYGEVTLTMRQQKPGEEFGFMQIPPAFIFRSKDGLLFQLFIENIPDELPKSPCTSVDYTKLVEGTFDRQPPPEKKYCIIKSKRLGNKKQVVKGDMTQSEAFEEFKKYHNTPFHIYTVAEQLFKPVP